MRTLGRLSLVYRLFFSDNIKSSKIQRVLATLIELTEKRVRYTEISSEVVRRRVKIASRELADASFEHGINLAFPRSPSARSWSAL